MWVHRGQCRVQRSSINPHRGVRVKNQQASEQGIISVGSYLRNYGRVLQPLVYFSRGGMDIAFQQAVGDMGYGSIKKPRRRLRGIEFVGNSTASCAFRVECRLYYTGSHNKSGCARPLCFWR